MEFFRTFTTISDGCQALFWEDKWINGEAAHEIVPYLYGLVFKQTCRSMTVCDGLNDRIWTRRISGGMSADALNEFLYLWNLLRDVQLNNQQQCGVGRQMDSTRSDQLIKCFTRDP